MPPHRRIQLHRDAPTMPPLGQPCTGCGVCCAWAPCPLGMVLSRRRHGRCRVLRWDGQRYVCSALAAPRRVWPWLPRALEGLARAWVLRAIAGGHGCDAQLERTPCKT